MASTLEAIAALASPARVSGLAVACAALRRRGVSRRTSWKPVQAAALAARVDATFIAAGRTLADFSLVAMDMDSTLITIECIDEIADMQGLKAEVSEITEAAMRGELDFSASLTRARRAAQGPGSVGARSACTKSGCACRRVRETMLAAVRAAGLKTLLVSGGFTFFTDRLKARLGLDYTHANVLEIEDGRLTGRVLAGSSMPRKRCAPWSGYARNSAWTRGARS